MKSYFLQKSKWLMPVLPTRWITVLVQSTAKHYQGAQEDLMSDSSSRQPAKVIKHPAAYRSLRRSEPAPKP
jgi:hypothetical protein